MQCWHLFRLSGQPERSQGQGPSKPGASPGIRGRQGRRCSGTVPAPSAELGEVSEEIPEAELGDRSESWLARGKRASPAPEPWDTGGGGASASTPGSPGTAGKLLAEQLGSAGFAAGAHPLLRVRSGDAANATAASAAGRGRPGGERDREERVTTGGATTGERPAMSTKRSSDSRRIGCRRGASAANT